MAAIIKPLLPIAVAAASMLSPVARATGPRTQGDQSQEYLLNLISSSAPSDISAIPSDFDCAWRKLAYDYGQTLQPGMSKEHASALFDGLELGALCEESFEESRRSGKTKLRSRSLLPSSSSASAIVLVVDASKGSDVPGTPGTTGRPFRTLGAAVEASRLARAAAPDTAAVSIQLRAGTYELSETVVLTEEDSGLTIESFNDEEAMLSGGRALDGVTWKSTGEKTADGTVIYSADLSHIEGLDAIPALQVGGNRATLARYPNANPERDLFPKGYITGATQWTAPVDAKGSTCDPKMQCGVSENVTIPVNDAWHGMYQNYEVGLGGACDRYDPPYSPWCSGNFYLERQFPEMHTRSPSGVEIGTRMSKYANGGVGATVHAWRTGHWYTWMFEVESTKPGKTVTDWTVHNNTNAISGDVPEPGTSTSVVNFLGNFDDAQACEAACKQSKLACHAWTYHTEAFGQPWARGCYGRTDDTFSATPETNVVSGQGPHTEGAELIFGAGGHQGGEGCDVAGEWFIENVREELDAANEYFYDASKKELLFAYNGTGSPPSSDAVVVPQLANFVELRGSQERPIRNVTIRGITVRASRPTFMDPRGNPSGGDWSLERLGAILLEGTEGVTVENCFFTHLDGNAVSINGYNRGLRIASNEFVNLGQNCIAAWGRADSNSGLAGNYPSGTVVEDNFAHEIGHIQKQSSFYFQAETAKTTIRRNIVFNIPRAAINFNDGFGGGNEMTENLLFNTCRESSDHGAFNSWDRLPYITDVREPGKPSSVPAVNNMHHNFIVANYAADGGCLDNDDGSSYYDIHHNACFFGGHKSDFDGNKKRSFENLHLFPNVYGTTCISIGAQNLPPEGYAEAYFNNTCVLPEAGSPYIKVAGDLRDPQAFKAGLTLSNNILYAPGEHVNVSVGPSTVSFEQFQRQGFDPTTRVVGEIPPTSELSAWVEQLLGFGEHHD